MGKRVNQTNIGGGFSKCQAEIRQSLIENDIKHNHTKLSSNFKKIVNQDCYGVQRKEIK